MYKRQLQAVEAAIRRETERQAAEEAESQARAASMTKPKLPDQTVVMVADDSKVVRIKTGRLLSAHRYQVVVAEDGLDAARQIGSSLPDEMCIRDSIRADFMRGQ